MFDVQGENAVEVKNVTKRFPSGDFHMDVLRGVDLVAKKGEILMIIGPSGCGKTTLLSMIAGTLRFDSGDVDLFGTSLKGLNDVQIVEYRKSHIGFIFQQYHLINTLTNLVNVSIPLLLNGVEQEIALMKSQEMLERVGLKSKGHLKSFHLSGGEQQRIAIARALIHEPPLLICDEPTSALDAESGTRIMKLLTEVGKSPNRCVIIVTHDNRIFKYADRIARMEDGLIIEYLNKSEAEKFH